MLLPLIIVAGAPTRRLYELRVSSAMTGIANVESAAAACHSGRFSGVFVTLESNGRAASDAERLAALSEDDRREFLQRECACRHLLRTSPVPVFAAADTEDLAGTAAGLFLAASHRICTQRTSIAFGDCPAGFSPGFGTLAVLSRLEPHIAAAVALGALRLNAHDCMALHLATHFTPSRASLDALRSELQASPPEYYDVPLSRRTDPDPVRVVPLCATDRNTPLDAALRDAFGPSASGMTDVRRRLERQRSIAAEHALALANEPCGIHIGTRERADTVRDVLTEASNNLEHSCPEALAATSAVLRLLHRQRRDMQYTDFDRLDQVLNAGLLAGQPEPASEGEAHGHAVADAVAAELAALVGARAVQ
mmetsp:Transcript_23516/g.63017  ORF Transcript_23516/g.63017 Transcript_23516/m.63017 type:complete len:366 (+) Transcript_23516:37-1134(+)